MNGQRSSIVPNARFEEILRNTLHVPDVQNPIEVAKALRLRYPQEAAKLDQESRGLTLASTAISPSGPGVGRVAPDFDACTEAATRFEQNLRSDLRALLDDAANREIKADLGAWQDTLLGELVAGVGAAREAADALHFDRAMLCVRRFADYAFTARLVASMRADVRGVFRRLASTLDDGQAIVRVLVGQSLCRAGYEDTAFILRVPQADLVQRRDGVLRALRSLTGVEASVEPWADNLATYIEVEAEINRGQAPELKVFLRESTVAPILDRLAHGGATRTSSRAAARQGRSSVDLDLIELRRFLNLAHQVLVRAIQNLGEHAISAGLSAYVQALRLFEAAFDRSRSGQRLVDLAMPLPLAVAALGHSDDEAGRARLRRLVLARSELAVQIECLNETDPFDPAVRPMTALVDFALFAVDRAIDLLALGEVGADRVDEAARLAVVYGRIVAAIEACVCTARDDIQKRPAVSCCPPARGPLDAIDASLREIQAILADPDECRSVRAGLLEAEIRDDVDRFTGVARSLGTRCPDNVSGCLLKILCDAGIDGRRGTVDWVITTPERVSHFVTAKVLQEQVSPRASGKPSGQAPRVPTEPRKPSGQAAEAPADPPSEGGPPAASGGLSSSTYQPPHAQHAAGGSEGEERDKGGDHGRGRRKS